MVTGVAWQTISKALPTDGIRPNMVDYDRECRSFTWEMARGWLDGLPDGRGLNIAHEAVDRHAIGSAGRRVAVRYFDQAGACRDVSYRDLARQSNRFAHALAALDVRPGETVFVLAPRSPALIAAIIGTLKHRAVVCPLFPAYGPEPIRQRLELGSGRVLVTTPLLYRRKIEKLRAFLPQLRHVLLIGRGSHPSGPLELDTLLSAHSSNYEIGATDPNDAALLHFTSGTTGAPKGAVHVHEAVVAHHATGRLALDLHPDDVFWCNADPGWVTGISYGIIAPLTCGATSIIDDGEFDAGRWYGILEEMAVNVWYTSPTALRMLIRAGPEAAAGHDLKALRLIAAVGEPLNPEVVLWAQEVLGLPVHDTWWQTETGGIMIGNYRCLDIRPGSMGRPFPGVRAAILARDDNDRIILDESGTAVQLADDEEGELALRPGWPSMFRSYLGDEARYQQRFVGGWYLTGDLARRDQDGYFWFVGRGDDVIKSAGHLIGPFEVESTLLEHPAVAEVGVIGKPDLVAGEIVKAFVTLRPGFDPTEELRLDLLGFARSRLGAAVAPREIAFEPQLPHTQSGKIMRRLLKAKEAGAGSATAEGMEDP